MDVALNRRLLGLEAEHSVSDRQVTQMSSDLAKCHSLRVLPACNNRLQPSNPREADALYSVLRSAAKAQGVHLPDRASMHVAPTSTSCCVGASVFGNLTSDKMGQEGLKKSKGIDERIVLMHSFYEHRAGKAVPTFGTCVIGGTLCHFSTVDWTSSDQVAQCPLGTGMKQAPVADAIAILSTRSCYLQPKKFGSSQLKGTLIFDGIECRPLLDATADRGNEVLTITKASQGVSAPGYSNGIAFFCSDGVVHPVLCQGQKDTRAQVNVFVSPLKPIGVGVFVIQAGNSSPFADQLFLRAIRESSRAAVAFTADGPGTKFVELVTESPIARTFSLTSRLALAEDDSQPFADAKRLKQLVRAAATTFGFCCACLVAGLMDWGMTIPFLVLVTLFVPTGAQTAIQDTSCSWRNSGQCAAAQGCMWDVSRQLCTVVTQRAVLDIPSVAPSNVTFSFAQTAITMVCIGATIWTHRDTIWKLYAQYILSTGCMSSLWC